MVRISVSREISAPPADVFRAVSDVQNIPERDPDVVRIEFSGERRVGVGTRFRETRRMNARELVTELEVTEYEPDRRVRMVSDTGGTVWDTVFSVEPSARGAVLTITMDARAHALLPRLLNPLMSWVFRRGMNKHLDGLAAHVEAKVASG